MEVGSTSSTEETRDRIILGLIITYLALVCMGCWLTTKGVELRVEGTGEDREALVELMGGDALGNTGEES